MYLDLTAGSPLLLQTRTCVIGAGAAGITAARALLAAGQEVVLIESGGLDYEPETSDLNAGENVGQDYYDLESCRLRFFGGTTAIWGGRCAELDPIDFERRSWVPHSGWPISYEEMKPYYERARRVFELPPDPSWDALRAAGMTIPHFDTSAIQPRLWCFDEAFNRFTFQSCRDLRDHPRCRIVTHATVTEIVAEEGGRGIAELRGGNAGGGRFTVKAQDYVLAAGGIENARILLASRDVFPTGLGNQHDQVGRYFMEHPHARGGRVVGAAAWDLLRGFELKHRVGSHGFSALVTPGEDLQRKEALLNTSLTIAARPPANADEALAIRAYKHLKHRVAPSRAGRALWMYSKKATRWAQQRVDPLRPWLLYRMGKVELALVVRAEQAPNPDSRVLLSEDRDPLGVPRVRLDWRTCELDVHSVRGLVSVLDSELRRLRLGRVEAADWLMDGSSEWRTDPLVSMHPIGGYHHMGTTRMSDSPRSGVVDRDGRVHGIGNLYVAGSSLFPTGGWANPTVTIVALALRTADRIAAAG